MPESFERDPADESLWEVVEGVALDAEDRADEIFARLAAGFPRLRETVGEMADVGFDLGSLDPSQESLIRDAVGFAYCIALRAKARADLFGSDE